MRPSRFQVALQYAASARWNHRINFLNVLAIVLLIAAAPRLHEVVGRVIDADTERPIAGARVGFQGMTERVLSDESGRFELPAGIGRRVVGWKSGYYIAGAAADAGSELTIRLRSHPTDDNGDYEWVDPAPAESAEIARDSVQNCGTCHADVYRQWAASSHARSALNPQFLDMFYGTDQRGHSNVGWNFMRDQPDARGVCSACHLPSVPVGSAVADDPGTASGVAREGIHCDFCHKISDSAFVHSTESLGLQHGRDALQLIRPAGKQLLFGPFDDVDRGADTYSSLYRSSVYCAACHEGTLFGTRVYETYTEWLASPYSDSGVECQNCHMKANGVVRNIAPGHGGIDRDPMTIATHQFAVSQDDEMLRSSVQLSLDGRRDGARIHASVTVQPRHVGHRLPTGSPDRHLVLMVQAIDNQGVSLQKVAGPNVPMAALGGGSKSLFAGKLYGKLLRGPDGLSPAPFWNAVAVESDTRLSPDEPDTVSFQFAADDSAAPVTLTARLIYRRFYKVVEQQKHWPNMEVELAKLQMAIGVQDP